MSRLPTRRTAIPGPRSRELAHTLRHCESPNITYLADDFPIFWESASGCWVTDVDGNTYLDMTSAFGVSAVGHCHPAVIAAVRGQAGKLMHGMGDVHPSDVKVALCKGISERVPIVDAQVILGQNGGDAVEAALKTACLATGKPGVVAFHGGYHGLSYGALNVTSRDDFRRPFLDQLGQFSTHLPYGCEIEAIDTVLARGQAGAVIVEPIQGRGGIFVPPPGWLPALHECCVRHSVLLILDEIFTGWGRTGSWFACDYDGVIPDILCIGKAMGGGLPISACVAPATVMSAWDRSRGEALHTSTFLGNPLSCAAALAAIGVMESEDLPSRARDMGEILFQRLSRLREAHPDAIRDVRGRGLMLGLQFSSPTLAIGLVPRALGEGLIVLPAGDGSVIEFVPPLTITQDEIATAVQILDECLINP